MVNHKLEVTGMAGTATRRTAAALAVFFVIFLAYSNVNAQGENPLFTSAAQYDVTAESRHRMEDQGPEVMRSRLVTLNTALITDQSIPAGDESILLNLFGDTNLVTVKDRLDVRPDGQYVWIGHVKDADHSSVIIVVKGTSMAQILPLMDRFLKFRRSKGSFTPFARWINPSWGRNRTLSRRRPGRFSI
jgi:hypothetical protein